MEDELTRARKAQIAAELRVLELEPLVDLLERQRDYADRLLLDLAALATGRVSHVHPAYTAAHKYLCEVDGVDKYERRLMEPGEDG
jgi:dTDP-4-amino-4,6-dideoxygalactose transaminase